MKKPFWTQVIISGTIAGMGDIIGQVVLEKRRTIKTYDFIRSARFAPVLYHWFHFLEQLSGQPKFRPLKRMLIDQIIMAPLLTFTFITTIHLLEGRKPGKAVEISRQQIGPILINNYKIWPLVQILNFYLIPLQYRVIMVQLIGVFWNAYISYTVQGSVPNSALNIE
ncbi:unnamed protein product [Thelazia callipaeda]|uniref:Mitochondrial inner membrane protein Mpv17 n=1 Tax=Thelazia callipaeda TaxID=103827 RepID=A0A0N5DBM5_THECL|nr:unnamed protein product [Thelazia callipaeda]